MGFERIIGRTFSTQAAAKLNLRLKIVGRRADGFHLLDMLNVCTDLEDSVSLTFRERPGVDIEVQSTETDAVLCDPARNLASRAASRILEICGAPIGAALRLHKRIPIGSGMGGGSADAAAVLRLMQGAFAQGGVEISDSALLAEGQRLGADIPYFLCGGLVRVSGIGERLVPFFAPPGLAMAGVLFRPAVGISTPELYAEYRRLFPIIPENATYELSVLSALSQEQASWYSSMLALIENDFERVLPQFARPVWEGLELVRSHPDVVAGLTGSGSAFFALPRQLGTDIHRLRAALEPALVERDISCQVIRLRTTPTY